ncbi:Nn.00g097870.m01.CDS01 [Neocucurbitaria sp. VM-36]
MPGWEEATAVQKLSTNEYSCILHDDWCIGSVPNGGYVTGCILEVVKTHFSTSLAKQNQPHTIALHVEFLRRTGTGPAIFKVDNVKLGRQTSIVHLSMEQEGRQEIIAYATNSNIDTEEGFSFDTEYTLSPPVSSVDLSKLEQDADPNWKRQAEMPFAKFRKASTKVAFHFPRDGQRALSVADEWLCFSDGTNFTDSSIGFVADMFPQIVESFRDKTQGPFWYPTLLLNLDIKKSLPPGGVKWLQVRVEMKKVKNGRMDLEVYVHDADGDLVALSHHVGFVLDASRNTAARRKPDTKI